ncbi:hypothetical protein ZIOFF_031408 [Zingiber officinale]|uniref:Uncharacterized protein n=1 Tax=Zingiber officinale TaxID=94328 RepID=A0A8J5L4W5_ZINOF|nr:hypothetical protein ZIOFF_031408 [Zingiber officinale]
MAGIIHKIEEKLHMGGDHKEEEKKHHKEEEKHHKEGESGGIIDKMKDKIHGEEHGEKEGKKKKKKERKHDHDGHSSSSSPSSYGRHSASLPAKGLPLAKGTLLYNSAPLSAKVLPSTEGYSILFRCLLKLFLQRKILCSAVYHSPSSSRRQSALQLYSLFAKVLPLAKGTLVHNSAPLPTKVLPQSTNTLFYNSAPLLAKIIPLAKGTMLHNFASLPIKGLPPAESTLFRCL